MRETPEVCVSAAHSGRCRRRPMYAEHVEDLGEATVGTPSLSSFRACTQVHELTFGTAIAVDRPNQHQLGDSMRYISEDVKDIERHVARRRLHRATSRQPGSRPCFAATVVSYAWRRLSDSLGRPPVYWQREQGDAGVTVVIWMAESALRLSGSCGA
jgi:hypothetical protein